MTFEDFLDMLNCFSENASRDVKVYYAFKIYGKYELNLVKDSILWKILPWPNLDYGNHFITAYDIEQTTAALMTN